MFDISVIIPTYQRETTLLRTLKSLDDMGFQSFEVLVCDNAPEPGCRSAVEIFARDAKMPVRYLRTPEADNASARNVGAIHAVADLLAFTDDDVTVSPGWLKSIYTAFTEHPEMLVASGAVKPVFSGPTPHWLQDYLDESPVNGPFVKILQSPHFTLSPEIMLCSANMIVRREVFSFTSFHPEIYGTKTVGDGESGTNLDLLERGVPIGFIPEALVFHHTSDERMTPAYIRRWAGRHCGTSQMYTAWRGKNITFQVVVRELCRITSCFLKYWIRYPFCKDKTTSKDLCVQYNASRGVWQLIYLWQMLFDTDVKDCLKIRNFALAKRYPEEMKRFRRDADSEERRNQ